MWNIIQRAKVITAIVLALALGTTAQPGEKSQMVDAEIGVRDGRAALSDCDLSEVRKLTEDIPAEDDRFGKAVAVDGDLAIVGSRSDDAPFPNSGAVYIFQRDWGGPDNWGEVIKRRASDAAENDYFGDSVSISSDMAIVGACCTDDAGHNSGSAYILQRDYGGPDKWGEVAKLTASDAAADDAFGSAVSISDDTAIVGAFHKNDAAGGAYIFQRDHGGPDNWGEVTKLAASDAAEYDYFGISVSISADTVIVASSSDDDNGDNSGSAYIFQRDYGGPDNWGEVAKLTASDAAAGAIFGYSASIGGDIAVVGADKAFGGGYQSGSAYIFQRDYGGADNWGEVTKLNASDAAARDYFGSAVSVSGNVIIIGARQDDHQRIGAGSLYLFRRDYGGPNNWGQVAKLIPSDTSTGAGFGSSASITNNTVAVGAPYDNSVGVRRGGSAYVFYVVGNDCNSNRTDDLCDLDPTDPDEDGEVSGDCDSSGIPDECEPGCNSNSVPDECDLDPSDPDGNGEVSSDCNANTIPDECDIADCSDESWCSDCNANDVPDQCDLDPADPDGNGEVSSDCNANTIPDECEPDCNNNGVTDACDVDPTDPDGNQEVSPDCDENGAPDECQPDCDDDTTPDVCELPPYGTSEDCNFNQVPDECEPDQDCNENTVRDICDIGAGTSDDCNFNSIPDACDIDPSDPDGNGEVSDDDDANGIPDECERLPPTLPADPMHQVPKNRYVSLDLSANGTLSVAYEVTLSEMDRCAGDTRRACRLYCTGTTPPESWIPCTVNDDCPSGGTCTVDRDCPGICTGNNDIQCSDDARCTANGAGTCVPGAPCGLHPDVGSVWYIGEPYTRTCFPNDDCVGQFFADVVSSPVFRVWTEDVVHVLGCEIVPVAVYEFRAVDQLSGAVGDPLTKGTIEKPQVHYGDCIGPVIAGAYTPSDGFVNVSDVKAYLSANRSGAPGTVVPHATWVDLHGVSMNICPDPIVSTGCIVPQQVLHVGDLQTVKFGFQGRTYAETPGQVDPGDCP